MIVNLNLFLQSRKEIQPPKQMIVNSFLQFRNSKNSLRFHNENSRPLSKWLSIRFFSFDIPKIHEGFIMKIHGPEKNSSRNFSSSQDFSLPTASFNAPLDLTEMRQLLDLAREVGETGEKKIKLIGWWVLMFKKRRFDHFNEILLKYDIISRISISNIMAVFKMWFDKSCMFHKGFMFARDHCARWGWDKQIVSQDVEMLLHCSSFCSQNAFGRL